MARVSLVVVGVTLATSIAVLTMRAFKTSLRLSSTDSATARAQSRDRAPTFIWFSGSSWVSIFLAVVVLNLIHYPDYILPGIALIVAVHFFPLAALFKAPVYYGTALGGCAIALVGFFMADAGLRQKSWIIFRWAVVGHGRVDRDGWPLLQRRRSGLTYARCDERSDLSAH